jgi:hypothetical protein
LIWLATARRLGLHVRRNAKIYSATDGTGLLELGPLDTLDPDDTTGQMIFHEICHWITNGRETFHERDWGFPLDIELDPRELACLRLQAHLAQRHGLRDMFGPTSDFRAYYDAIPEDTLTPIDDSPREADVCAIAREAIARAGEAPWAEAVQEALCATAELRGVLRRFLGDYATDVPDDSLPSLWAGVPRERVPAGVMAPGVPVR